MKVENGKWKTENGKLKIWGKFFLAAGILSGGLLFASCDTLQDSLSSEQKADLIEETGSASIAGKVWYYDGISTTDFSKTEGAFLAVSFSKKAALIGTREISDDGTVTYNYELNGSLTSNYTTTTGQSSSIVTKISGGKIILDSVSSPVVSISAGSMSADGKTFRLDMTPIVYLLDAETAKGNVIDSVEVKLNGFVCDEGKQKGRAIAALSQKIAVKPFYDNETITDGIVFTTISSTLGKVISIPTKGSVGLTSDAKIEFSSTDSGAAELSSSDFTLGTDSKGLTISCSKDLKGKVFTGTFKISGFVPELNASSYTRTFKVDFSSMHITEDSLSADSGANPTSASGASFDISSMGVYNDSSNLYVQLKFTNAPKFYKGDTITILLDNPNDSTGNALSTSVSWTETEERRGFGTKVTAATGTSVEAQITTFVNDTEFKTRFDKMNTENPKTDVVACLDSSGNSVTSSYNSSAYLCEFSSATLIYKIPLSEIALEADDHVYVYAVVSHHGDDNKNLYSGVADHIPTCALTNSDGSAVVSSWAEANTDYVLDMKKAFEYAVTASE